MRELKEVFDMVTNQTEPDLDSWQQQESKQRRAAHNRKVGALVVAAAIVLIGAVFILIDRGADEADLTRTPGTNGVGTIQVDHTPPEGPQLVDSEGRVVEQLAGTSPSSRGLNLSPDGSTIAFMHVGDLSVVQRDGTELRVLVHDATDGDGGDAMKATSWSPDGTHIAFASDGQLFTVALDGSDLTQVTTEGGYYPEWSPDGSTLLYWNGSSTGEDGGPADSEIFTIPVGGGTPTQLTDNDVSNIEPTWSPDGARIAYWEGGQLWTMRADGSHQRHIYSDEGGVWAPAWSPDGKRIAYIAYVGNLPPAGVPILELRVLDLRSGKVTKTGAEVLTDDSGPQWVTNDAILVNRWD
jgi:Tol biopolymer transport system component